MKTNYIKLLDGTTLHPNYFYVTSCGIVRRFIDGKIVGNTYSLEYSNEFIKEKTTIEDIVENSVKSNEEVKAIISHL